MAVASAEESLYCVLLHTCWDARQEGRETLSGLLEGLSNIVLAARTLSAEKQTLVVPVGSLTTLARSVSLSCDAASSP